MLKFEETSYKEKNIEKVKHIKASGIVTNDDNIKTQQDVNILVKDHEVEIATWAMFEEGKYRLGHVLEIAENFEEKNPDYIVLGAVNADYFYMRSLEDVMVNACVIYGGRVLNSSNHPKYQALKFNSTSKSFQNIKETKASKNLYLYVYENNQLIDKKIIYLNDLSKEITLIKGGKKMDNSININVTYEFNNENLIFIEGETVEYNTNYQIVNKSSMNLQAKQKIKIQYEVLNIDDGDMLVGFDGKLIENNYIYKFDEMTGQSLEHNTDRHPRTAIGINNEGKIIIGAVDGRLEHSIGVDNREFASILNYYGVNEAYNLDGGGSTQVVFRIDNKLQIINTPSELPLRPVSNVILFIKKIIND